MNTRPVSGIPCPCPKQGDDDWPGPPDEDEKGHVRHPEGDTVELRERLGLAAGIEIQATVRGLIGQPDGVIVGALVEAYVKHGIAAWTFVDDIGAPVPVTPENIQRIVLDDFTLATPLAEAADALYEDAVLGPLVGRAATLSPTTPTESSTSATDSGSDDNQTPSPPSSTTSTPTAATVTTSLSLVGDSSSSPTDPMDQLLDAS